MPARLELGTATRSGLWSPAPLRPDPVRRVSGAVSDQSAGACAETRGLPARCPVPR